MDWDQAVAVGFDMLTHAKSLLISPNIDLGLGRPVGMARARGVSPSPFVPFSKRTGLI
jgi:hypothetical protein